MLVEGPIKSLRMALNNFQEPTVNRELSQERKERPNKHDCSREAGVGKVHIRSDASVEQSWGGLVSGDL